MTTSAAADAHLGIDLGTSSVKVVLLSRQGAELSQADASYVVHHPQPGWAESAPLDWWRATASALRAATAKAPQARPVSIGLSGQMHGVVATRSDGTPVRDGILWADSRAREQLETYRCLPPDARHRLANPPSPGMAGPILGWLVRHERAITAEMRWALQPKDWLRLQLTGEVHTDPSDASATLMYDALGDAWAADVVEALGVDTEVLPPVLPSSASCGGFLSRTAADVLGLEADIPVAAGGDTAAAALGSGLVLPGTAQLTIGTGVQLVTPSNQPPVETADPVTHYYRAATDTGHYRMAAVLNGGLALRWVCDTLDATWAELYAVAEQPPSADAPLFLPHLNGERTPYMDTSMRGAWTSLSPRHRRTDLLRSALEGVAFAAAEALTHSCRTLRRWTTSVSPAAVRRPRPGARCSPTCSTSSSGPSRCPGPQDVRRSWELVRPVCWTSRRSWTWVRRQSPRSSAPTPQRHPGTATGEPGSETRSSTFGQPVRRRASSRCDDVVTSSISASAPQAHGAPPHK